MSIVMGSFGECHPPIAPAPGSSETCETPFWAKSVPNNPGLSCTENSELYSSLALASGLVEPFLTNNEVKAPTYTSPHDPAVGAALVKELWKP